ncbi:MAG: hypothetical protein KJI72_04025 [Patescibacteria group bacterium]|nr:hypothetical protein [Patescibacteria group bacterium]
MIQGNYKVFDVKNSLCDEGVISYKYDENGQLIEKDCQLDNNIIHNSIAGRFVYQYDDEGRIVHELCFDCTSGETIYKYNDGGVLTSRRWQHLGWDDFIECEYTYDMEGSLVKERCLDGNDYFGSGEEYVYDKCGNIIQYYYDNELISRFKYKYDSKGNWVRKVEFVVDRRSDDKISQANCIMRNILYWKEG